MKKSFVLTATLLSLSAASQAAIIWSDDYSSGRDTDIIDPNPYSYTGSAGNDYGITTGDNAFTVANGYLNIADTTTATTPFIQVASNRFSTTTFNAGDTFTVSMDIRVNSLSIATSGSASAPRFTIFTGNANSGGESLTVGFTYGNFNGQPNNTLGFYKGGASAGGVNLANGIGVGSAGFNFGVYDSTTATNNDTGGWFRITVNMTQGSQAYTGSITNLTTSDSASFSGGLVNALNWGDNVNGGVRIFAGQGGLSNFDIDNLVVNHVPEPSSVALFGGLGALALLRRRRA